MEDLDSAEFSAHTEALISPGAGWTTKGCKQPRARSGELTMCRMIQVGY